MSAIAENQNQFIQTVESIRQKNLDTYALDSNRFKSDIQSETEIRKMYKGRQLLELLQNADDAQAESVKIIKDKANRTIKICNSGNPFSANGFGALMLAYNGTKTPGKKDFIGNKGLGFRSILNWADSVDVKSNGCWLHFSKETAYSVAKNKLANCWEAIQETINTLGRVNNEIAPILSLPDIKPCDTKIDGWDTEITIKYKDDIDTENDVNEQLDFITSKTLLFIHHIKSLEISGTKNDRLFSSASNNDFQDEEFESLSITEKIANNLTSHKYRIFRTEGLVPEDIQKREQGTEQTVNRLYYEVCLALDGEIGKREYLYSYFRTNIMLNLPCIVHAAFVLDPSRNYLIAKSVVNEFLIQEILKLFEKVAKFLCKDEKKSWRAYQLLYMKDKPDEAAEYLCQLYDGLHKLRYTCDIFPCVDGKYREESDVYYYDDFFSQFINDYYSKIFPDMLIPMQEFCKENIKAYDEDTIWAKLDEICNLDLSVTKRVDLLKALSNQNVISKISNPDVDSKDTNDEKGRPVKVPKHILKILLDGKNNLIEPTRTIYTTPTKDLEIPDFARISFISQEMYEELKRNFPCENSEGPETDSIARHICDCISHYVKLKSYDAATLTPDIIRILNKIINKYKDDKYLNYVKNCVKKAIQALFHNYLVSSEATAGSEKKYEGIQLLAKNGNIVDAKSLYLSKNYPSGNITEVLYGDTISDKEYLADCSTWEIDLSSVSREKLESFFCLCGVTKFIKYNANFILDVESDTTDINYLTECLAPDCEEYRSYQKKPNNPICKLSDITKLDSLDLTKLLILLSKETKIYAEIMHGTTLCFSQEHAKGQYNKLIRTSLIAYQLQKRFSSVILKKDDSEMNFLLNPNGEIDYSLLKSYDVEASAEEILVRLGAKKSFQELTSDALYAMIRRVYDNKARYEGGRRIAKIYGDIYDVLKKQQVHNHGDLTLACRLGGLACFKRNSDIYYYDDAKLPKTILDKYPILLLRQRAGVKQVVEIFGVKRLDDTSLVVKDDLMVKDDILSKKFNEYYYERIPFIVMQRIRNLNGSQKSQEDAANDANIVFHLVKSGKYTFNSEERELQEFEFLVLGRNAYIKIPNYSIENLVRNKKFLEVFSEILGIAFALESSELKKVFKTILRDDIPTLKADADDDSDEYERAMELLNRSTSRQVMFWNKILSKNGLPIYNNSNQKSIEEYIQETLQYTLPNYYRNIDFSLFDDEDSLKFVKDIHNKLNLELKDFLPDFGLEHYHTERIKDYINSFHNVFISQLWNLLKDQDESAKKTYCKKCAEYDNCEDQIITDIYKFTIIDNYETLFKSFIKSAYDVNLDEGEINNFKGILYEKYKDGNDTSLIIEERSLLYFEGYDKKFANITESIETDDNPTNEDSSDVKTDIIGVTGTLIPVIKAPKDDEHSHSKGPWLSNERERHLKKKAGKRAQDTVMQYLKDKYGEECRRLRSSESNDPSKNDSAHYDISYCEGNSGEATTWRYLEVKNASSGSFVISEAEIKYGCKPENQKKYDLALVDGSKVQIVKAFFKDKTIDSFISEFQPQIHRDFLVPFKFEENHSGEQST